MKIPPLPHRWDVSPRRAVAIQKALAAKVRQIPVTRPIHLVAGADVAFTPAGDKAVAAVVVWNLATGCQVETQSATRPLRFPYVPGLLTFREGPALLAAFRRLKCEPDAFLFDGQGIAHPRRFGLAAHLGLLIDRPSVGCGKSRLVGVCSEPGQRRGSVKPIMDHDERIGSVLRTRSRVKCIYVSVGHKITLDQAVRLVLECGAGYRLPEPTRLADWLVGEIKRNL